MKYKPTVGEQLFSLNIGNAIRHREQKLTPVTVTKVGRKYFDAIKEGRYRSATYHIDTWTEKSEVCADSKLYKNPEEWEDEKEAKEVFDRLRPMFDYGGSARKLSADSLRGIERMIEANKGKP